MFQMIVYIKLIKSAKYKDAMLVTTVIKKTAKSMSHSKANTSKLKTVEFWNMV